MSGLSGRSKASNDSRASGKFDALYQDAKRRNERKVNIYSACLSSECTFQPDIEKTKFSYARMSRSKRGSRSNSLPRSRSRTEMIIEGMSNTGKTTNSREQRSQLMLANSQTLSNDLYDPETG